MNIDEAERRLKSFLLGRYADDGAGDYAIGPVAKNAPSDPPAAQGTPIGAAYLDWCNAHGMKLTLAQMKLVEKYGQKLPHIRMARKFWPA